MFDISALKLDKFVHDFIQKLNRKVESPLRRTCNNSNFIAYMHNSCKLKQELLSVTERMHDIAIQERFDLSDEKSVRHFIEEHTNFFDKLVYFNNVPILSSNLRNINQKIVQKVKLKRNTFKNMKKPEEYSLFNKESHMNHHNCERRRQRVAVTLNSITIQCNEDMNVLKGNQDSYRHHGRRNPSIGRIYYAKKKIEMLERSLWLYTKDVDFIKRHVQINLYIAKELRCNSQVVKKLKVDQLGLLCRQAILCLIEPSSRAFVFFENDLDAVLQKYLAEGYEYHFNCHSDSKDSYTALLILSQWARMLVKHSNTTMMRTICGILRCEAEKILVLSYPTETVTIRS